VSWGTFPNVPHGLLPPVQGVGHPRRRRASTTSNPISASATPVGSGTAWGAGATLKSISRKAENGEVALSLYQTHSQEISLVILDLIMPVMNGVDTYKRLKALDPELRILPSSGYSRQKVTDKLFELGIAGFIQKPYTLKKLAKVVSQALAPAGDERPPADPAADRS